MGKKVSKVKVVKPIAVNFNPKAVTKRLLGALTTRAKDVIIKRYGLGDKTKRMTLESIGGEYGITRERVRQIENYALQTIRKADAYKKEAGVFELLKEEMLFFGGIVSEEHFLEHLSKEGSARNHFHFLLVVGDTFEKRKEDDHFEHRWHADEDIAEKVEDALKRMYEKLSDEELLSETEIIKMFLDHVKDLSDKYRDEEMVKRWLLISKKIGSNDLGEWGPSASPSITPKGIRDYAYLAIRNHGSPLHFTEVAKRIEELFDKKAHVATAHNELIKDERFVLVGRGLYALSEWGYVEGVVRDVIRKILKEHGALTKEEVIEKVLKERYVKPNTILVNLQDSKHFSKKGDGTYTLN
ncbi:MAG: sigma factor-like helix-turn-helix DNA-binding protein [Patescibacteria group bacterium]